MNHSPKAATAATELGSTPEKCGDGDFFSSAWNAGHQRHAHSFPSFQYSEAF